MLPCCSGGFQRAARALTDLRITTSRALMDWSWGDERVSSIQLLHFVIVAAIRVFVDQSPELFSAHADVRGDAISSLRNALRRFL